MPSFETLIYEKRGAVAHISLNRPNSLNAYNVQMRDDVSESLSAVADDPEVRALLFTGEGRAFCTGADLTEFGSAPSLVIARQVRWQRDVWGQMINLDKPVVAAVHGFCIGSGLEIALLCDVRVAAEGTVFAMPEVRLGMIPAAGGTQTLPRNAGTSQALELLLTGRRFTAEGALAMGIVTRIAASDQLMNVAWEIAFQVAETSPWAAASMKRSLREGGDMALGDALDLETRIVSMSPGL